MDSEQPEIRPQRSPDTGVPTFSSKVDSSSFNSSEVCKSFHMTNITLDFTKMLEDVDDDSETSEELAIVPFN